MNSPHMRKANGAGTPPRFRNSSEASYNSLKLGASNQNFWNTATLKVCGGSVRRGVDLRRAWFLVRWNLVLDGLHQDLNDFVFGK